MIDTHIKTQSDFISTLAEVPGAAWINMQPAEHLLFCKKMCPWAYGVSSPPGPGRGGGGVKLAP